MKREIITTKDGSPTVFIPEAGVTYHSHHGAVQESLHVFIEAGLRWYLNQRKQKSPVRIFEMGLGTALNAYLSLLESASQNLAVHYTAVEQHPLLPHEVDLLHYAATPQEAPLFKLLHAAPWQQDVAITPLFTLRKEETGLIDFVPEHLFDLIYFDAFAPMAQPELWTEAVFKKMHGLLLPGGVLVTYCSKGVVRRAMQAAGFAVEKIPGPPGKEKWCGHKEMYRCW